MMPMRATLNPAPLRVLNFIEQYIETYGESPKYTQIAEGVGLRSISTVHKHISVLVCKGFVTDPANGANKLWIKGKRPKCPHCGGGL